ncbi:HCP-like protein [Backusella circina FSU 941]|nr:HCP-like protein [Backusella circina FSU 941]
MIRHEKEEINSLLGIVKKAIEGDVISQLELGKVYLDAILVENNCQTAFNWILCSAEQGNMEAQFRLGDLYALGHGTPKSFSDVYHWYTKAAIQGYKKALIRLHNLYQEDTRMHCRGQINSEEEQWASGKFKKENKIRELSEYRLKQKNSILNGAVDYYTSQFKYFQSSDQNDHDVQLNLAFLYQHGYGVKKCIRWAFEYYTMAANQGSIDAQYNLGDLYKQHKDMKFNTRQAFEWYTKSARGGNIAAQKSLAYFYHKGLATNIDCDAALSWYTKAAEAGDSEAQVILGKLYRKGDCVKQDLSIAVKWYSRAARQGSHVAQNCLSQLQQRNMLSSVRLEEDMSEYATDDSINKRLCSKLAKDMTRLGASPKFKPLHKLTRRILIGDGQAMYEIGLKYFHGGNEFIQNRDQETGIKWIKKAAFAKNKNAQSMMADLYKKGDSIEQDYRKAVIWYKTLAKKKVPNAQCNVGIMYDEGFGVRQDPLEASKWFTWSENNGNSDGQYYLSMLRFDGRGLRQDEEEAVKWLFKAARQRNIQACYKLGNIYFHGQFHIEEDTKRGQLLLEFAAKNGCTDAQIKMARIYIEGREEQRDKQKYIEYCTMAADSGNAEAQYNLAIALINRRGVNHDYIKIYNLIKQAKEKGLDSAKMLFQIPMEYDFNIKDYYKLVEMFIDVTEEGIDDLNYHIGSIYEFGVTYFGSRQTVLKDYAEAGEWYSIASNNGDAKADYRLGMMYQHGKGVKANLKAGINYYNKASKKGNGDANYKLACFYFNGYGVTQDLLKAFHFYTMASTMGHKEATKVLNAFENYNKNGINPDILLKQIRMLEKATERGYTRLQYRLGLMYENDNDNSKAIRWFSLAADIGVTDAYYRLGVLYEEGRGIEQDYIMAANMYQKATGKEHIDAFFRFARLYQYGNGVKLDYLKAYQFYKKAADMGHLQAHKVLNITPKAKISFDGVAKEKYFSPSSQEYQDSLLMCKYVAEHGNTEVQFKLGFAYEYTISKPDYAEAYHWYSLAARSYHREAVYHLGLLYEKGLQVSRDYQIAILLYDQASQLGSDDAHYQLGVSYHYGKGVEVDPIKAVEYYTRSVEFGNPKYQCKFGRLYEEGKLVDKNLLEAIKWYTKAYLEGYDKIRQKLHDIYEDKPYETFFYEKLFRILSTASCGHFRLNVDYYYYNDYSYINNRLGSLYLSGQGTAKDSEQALLCFSKKYNFEYDTITHSLLFLKDNSLNHSQKNDILKAFTENEAFLNQIDIEQLYTLGVIFFDGIAQIESIDWCKFGIRYISIDSHDQGYLSEYLVIEKDYSRAFKCLEKAANKNHSLAMLQLGIMYHCGYGVEQNNDQGERYFNDAANENIEFTEQIAALYHTYDGLKDFTKALEWYRCLEKRLDEHLNHYIYGRINEQLQVGLGLLYEYGDGVEQDYQKAMEYYKKLADNDIKIGIHRLGLMHYYGKGVLVDYKESFRLFERATLDNLWWGEKLVFVFDQNDSYRSSSQRNLVYSTMNKNAVDGESHYYLGLLYKNGQGVHQDEIKSQHHFRTAFEHGCKRAKDKIEN